MTKRKRQLKIFILHFICATIHVLRDYLYSFNLYKNYPGTRLGGVVLELRNRMINSPWCDHVLDKTLNLVISSCYFAEDGKEMYKKFNVRAA